MTVQVIDDFLDKDLIEELNDISLETFDLAFADSKSWQDSLRIGDTDVKMYGLYCSKENHILNGNAIYKELTDEVINQCISSFNLSCRYIDLYYWPVNSAISWHNDAAYDASATIYLNSEWHIDWGGYFVWQEEEKLEKGFVNAIKPKYNRCIFNGGQIPHAVTPTIQDKNIDEPLIRRTVQLRF
jgi:Rps23 Pro-64 3,4-dihydroxylase Tpa1-like proline 4-hydroxylase